MTKSQAVMASINSDYETRRIDVFARAYGSYGFEEFRRDPEDPRGWFPIGGFMNSRFTEPEQALARARASINWLASENPG